MAVSDEGEVAGSVSGGCVEGAVVAEALEVLADGQPRLCTFGYSDQEAFAVGIDLWRDHPGVCRTAGLVSQLYAVLRDCLKAEEPVALATVIEVSSDPGEASVSSAVPPRLGIEVAGAAVTDDVLGSLGDADLDHAVAHDLRGALESGLTGERHYGWRGPDQRHVGLRVHRSRSPRHRTW